METLSSTQSIELQVSACNILSGGWIFTYTLHDLDNLPTVSLCLIFGEKKIAVKVSGKLNRRNTQGGHSYEVDLKSNRLAKLQEILNAIAEHEAWSTTFKVQVILENGNTKYLSNQQLVTAPAKPLDKLSVSAIRGDQHVYYLRDEKTGEFMGRLITKVGPRYYFAYTGYPPLGMKFETEDACRGMDCTTFVLGVFEMRAALGNVNGYGVHELFGAAAEQVSYSPFEDSQRQISCLRVEENGKFMADKIGVDIVNLLLDDLIGTRRLYLFACKHHVFYLLGDTFHEFNITSGQKMVSGYKTGKIKAKFSNLKSSDKWSLYRIDKSLPL